MRHTTPSHARSNSGGGGERVLWQGLHSLRSLGDTEHVPIEFVIYSGDPDITVEDAKAAVLVCAHAPCLCAMCRAVARGATWEHACV